VDETSTRPLIPPLRAMLWLFAGLALVAGVLLFVLSEQTDRSFSWTIKPPLTAAFIGASYWAALVLIAWSASRRSWARARAALPPVMVIAVLLLVATLIHVDRFHKDSVFGWFWIVVYVIVPPALGFLLWRQLRSPGEDAPGRQPLPGPLRALIWAQGLAMLGVGAALFVAPTDADAIWPWALTPLTARAVGAFVFGFGVAAADAARRNDLRGFEGSAFAYTALGALQLLALARYSGDLTGADVDSWIYAGFLASVCAAGGYASLRALASRRLSSASAASS
jgi:hypothetical protein